MISKNRQINILIIIVLSFSCCSCTTPRMGSKPIVDINGFVIIDKVSNKSVFYIRENGERIKCSKGIEFDGGREALKGYLDSVYYNNPNYHKYSEFNVLETFIILFDEYLNIKEVRIMHRYYADNERFYYDSLFVNALQNTNGKWYENIQNKKWYYYLHRQRIY
ncbi:hypothetical protein [Bacteroides sp. UBA939]|uniref:hypothetical protein n=1 Tax=Bacteroides sp. UBA939 TaxID=1946092 RepID=UPI0025BB43A1|nr:hypothetical protein [Bacteroides sp. UBA939]